MIEHVKIPGGTYVVGAYSLSRVNSLHSSLDKFISKDLESKPATKYLDLYLMMFWWLQKNKDVSNTDLVSRLFSIMTGNIDNDSRTKMLPITIESLNSREFPIDTKNYF